MTLDGRGSHPNMISYLRWHTTNKSSDEEEEGGGGKKDPKSSDVIHGQPSCSFFIVFLLHRARKSAMHNEFYLGVIHIFQI